MPYKPETLVPNRKGRGPNTAPYGTLSSRDGLLHASKCLGDARAMEVYRTNPRGERLLITHDTVYLLINGKQFVIHEWGMEPGAYIPR